MKYANTQIRKYGKIKRCIFILILEYIAMKYKIIKQKLALH